MYSFTPEQEQHIQIKGKALIGQVFKYKQLCSVLDIEPKTAGNSRKRHIQDINNIIKLKEIDMNGLTAYQIIDVYETPLVPYYDEEMWYKAVKSRMCKILKDTPKDSFMWFTRTPLLYAMNMVNQNYKVLMNPVANQKLSTKLNRDLDDEKEVCSIIGTILSNRLYDALEKMGKERIIQYNDGFVVKVMMQYPGSKEIVTRFIPAPVSSEKDSLFQVICALENQVIDDISSNHKFYTKDAAFKNRAKCRQLYYFEFIQLRDTLAQEKTGEMGKWIKEHAPYCLDVKAVYDAKFMTPIWKEVDKQIEELDRDYEILNKSAQEKIRSTKNKEMARFNELREGIINICIDSSTKIDYSKIIGGYRESFLTK